MNMQKSNYEFKIIFHILDYNEKSFYNYIKLKSLHNVPIKINQENITIPITLNKNNNQKGEYKEIIYLLRENEISDESKTFVVNLSCGIDNIINICIKEEGDIGIEFEKMWDIGNKKDNKEREITDIKYNGIIIKSCENLYERKRWNILNARIDLIQKHLISYNTLNYLLNNKNKSYKCDLLISEEGTKIFLKEITANEEIYFLNKEEKTKLKKKIESLNISFYKRVKNNIKPAKILSKKKPLLPQ